MIQGVSPSSSSGLLGRMVADWLAKVFKIDQSKLSFAPG